MTVGFFELGGSLKFGHAQVLLPYGGAEIAGCVQSMGNRIGELRGLRGQRFSEDATVHVFRRRDSQDVQDGWREVNVAGGQLVNHSFAEVGASGNECVMYIEWTEAGVDSPSRAVAAVAGDQAGDLLRVLVRGPPEREGNVRRVRGINADL